MKNTLLIVTFFITYHCLAQNVFVPYRVGEKWGLSDEHGKLVVQPVYENVEYVKGDYFSFEVKGKFTDTTKDLNRWLIERRESGVGLFQKNKILIPAQRYREFLIYKYFIIASENEFRPEKCALYNLRGEKLINEPIRAMYVNDRRDIGNLGDITDKFSLLTVIQRDAQDQNITSIAVYDNVKQMISKWLIEKVYEFKMDETQPAQTYVVVTFRDKNAEQEKYLRYANGRFETIDAKGISAAEKKKMKAERSDFIETSQSNVVEEVMTVVPDEVTKQVAAVAPVSREPSEEDVQIRKGYIRYEIKGDSLFYSTPTQRILVKTSPEIKLILVEKKSNYQVPSIIFKKGQGFGLVKRGIVGDAEYDSLVYFGKNYVASKKVNGKLQYGMIDRNGKVIIPFAYDSITGDMQEFRWDSDYTTPERRSIIAFADKRNSEVNPNPYVKKPGNAIAAWKNGKTGLLNEQNETVFPFNYDLIAENGMSFMTPKEENFIVVRKGGLYGIARWVYNNVSKKEALQAIVAPVLKYIPCFYITDFSGKKGLAMYGVYNLDHQFLGYANEKGFLYFSE